jgi:hypothetical protein
MITPHPQPPRARGSEGVGDPQLDFELTDAGLEALSNYQ